MRAKGNQGLMQLRAGFVFILFAVFIFAIPVRAEIYMYISGNVRDAATGKGIKDVEILAGGVTNKQNFSAKTDSYGNYYIKIVPEGEYTLYVQPPKRYVFKPYTKTVIVEKGKNVVDANFELPLGGAISGIIYKSDGITPLGNASIFALTNKGVSMTSTDSMGKYVLSGLEPESSTRLRLITYGYGIVILDNLAIKPGQITPNINIKLPVTTSGIRGMVSTYDSVGIPVPDAFVILNGENGFGIATTDSNGNYIINGLPKGTYEAIVFKIGFERKVIGNIIVSDEGFIVQHFSLADQPLPTTQGFNKHEMINTIALTFPIDNQESPHASLHLTATEGCICASFSFTGALGIGMSIGTAKCVCTWQCGKTQCTEIKTVNLICTCFGLGIGVSGEVQLCWRVPKTGYTDFVNISYGPVSVTFGGNCAGGGVGAGYGAYWCSCFADVSR